MGTKPRSTLRRADGRAIRVLVVEDEPSLAELLTSVLGSHGWQVSTVTTGQAAVSVVQSVQPDAVLLDLGLSDIDGLEVLAGIRANDSEVAVVILTARDDAEDRTAALLGGAEDYITKPFGVADLLDRLGMAMRHHGLQAEDSPVGLTVGDLYINATTRDVRRGDVPISLSATEFELLLQLATNVGIPMSKAQIIDHVWHYDFGASSHIVELSIAALRQKIDADRTPMIRTVGDRYALLATNPNEVLAVV